MLARSCRRQLRHIDRSRASRRRACFVSVSRQATWIRRPPECKKNRGLRALSFGCAVEFSGMLQKRYRIWGWICECKSAKTGTHHRGPGAMGQESGWKWVGHTTEGHTLRGGIEAGLHQRAWKRGTHHRATSYGWESAGVSAEGPGQGCPFARVHAC